MITGQFSNILFLNLSFYTFPAYIFSHYIQLVVLEVPCSSLITSLLTHHCRSHGTVSLQPMAYSHAEDILSSHAAELKEALFQLCSHCVISVPLQ